MGVWGRQVEWASDANGLSRSRPDMRLESKEEQRALPGGNRLMEATQGSGGQQASISIDYRSSSGERYEVHTEGEGEHFPSKRKGHRL